VCTAGPDPARAETVARRYGISREDVDTALKIIKDVAAQG
jgi:hypothetical protein